MALTSAVSGSAERQWVAHDGDRHIRVRDGRRSARVVDHVEDAALPMRLVEEDREQVLKTSHGERVGHLEGPRREYVDALVEERIAAHSITMESRHVVADLERRPSVDTRRLHPGGLARHVIGHLVLEEDVRPAVSVPDPLVVLELLD